MPSYTLREPHPTAPQNSYAHSGRGGAGNFFRAPVTTPSAGVVTSYPATTAPPTTTYQTTASSSAAAPSSSSSSSSRFYSGRGGAGNAHYSGAERHVLSFDEEYALADARERRQSAGHVGRGGAGNVYGLASGGGAGSRSAARKERKHSSGGGSDAGSVRRDSDSTTGSERSAGFWGRLSGASLRQ